MSGPPLWLVERGDARVYLFGGGPPQPEPWSSLEIEDVVRSCGVFWNEVPKMGPEALPFAQQYGIDPAAPLAAWLSDAEVARVRDVAASVGVRFEMLAALRPWLAAQSIKSAAEARAGLHAEYSAEAHLGAVAAEAGAEIRSEFGAPEDVFRAFSSWPREVERQRLLSTLAEADAEGLREQARAWRDGDLAHAEEMDGIRLEFPALYEFLVRQRNHAWLPRIEQALGGGGQTFILMGTGHLVGAEGVLALLDAAGMTAARIT
jgi:uncharacterized protein YbaP (TraB family)